MKKKNTSRLRLNLAFRSDLAAKKEKHKGKIKSTPYGFQAKCSCGWRMKKHTYYPMAYDILLKHYGVRKEDLIDGEESAGRNYYKFNQDGEILYGGNEGE